MLADADTPRSPLKRKQRYQKRTATTESDAVSANMEVDSDSDDETNSNDFDTIQSNLLPAFDNQTQETPTQQSVLTEMTPSSPPNSSSPSPSIAATTPLPQSHLPPRNSHYNQPMDLAGAPDE